VAAAAQCPREKMSWLRRDTRAALIKPNQPSRT